MNLIAEAADWTGDNDAARHMAHYLGNSGTDMELPIDKMMSDVPGFRAHIEDGIREHQDAWRDQALAEFQRNGGQPVSIPVETGNRDFSFTKDVDENWFYAVGSTRSNVTGVVTVVPDASGQPKVGLDYQANALGPLQLGPGQRRDHRPSWGRRHEHSGRSDGPPPHHGHRSGIRHGGQQFRQTLRSGRIRPEPRSSAAAGRARA
ncbi:hypothetical protein [Streptomyces sp. NPDC088139]|uniref:hypothetical protein n=1 Tax=Streptomyces sp. NPDC088139 TaxID=3365828 RepID=UPI00381334C5